MTFTYNIHEAHPSALALSAVTFCPDFILDGETKSGEVAHNDRQMQMTCATRCFDALAHKGGGS